MAEETTTTPAPAAESSSSAPSSTSSSGGRREGSSSSGGRREGSSSSGDRRSGGRGQGPPRRGGRRPRGRPRRTTACSSRCVGKQMRKITYKNVDGLQRYITERGKIRPRRQTGNCAKHQRALAREIKRARYLALLPYTADHSFTSERRAPERRR